MKAALMSKLGLDDRQAAQAIASLPNNVLAEILDFIEKVGPYARQAIMVALPFLLKGDTWGAIKAVILYLLTLIPPAPVEQFSTGKVETKTEETAPSADLPQPIPPQPTPPHGKKR